MESDDDPDTYGLTVAQMAALVGISAHTLRYYERAGLMHAVPRDATGRRRYRAADAEWVRFLLRLHETGMPIRQMRTYAHHRSVGKDSLAARLELLEAHLLVLEAELTKLQGHREALETKIATYRAALVNRAPGMRDDTKGAKDHGRT